MASALVGLGCSGGSSSTDAATPNIRPDATADAIVPADADADTDDGPASGDFFGSVVWRIGAPEGFDVSAVFVVGVRSVARKDCENGTQAGSCCFTGSGQCTPGSDGGVVCTGGGNSPTAQSGSPGAGMAGACPRFGDQPDLNADVGVLSFTGNGQSIGSGLRDPQVGYFFRPLDAAGPSWQAGDRLGVSAPGGPCIPAFAGSLPSVGPLNISVPQLPYAIQINQGFDLRWTPDPNADTVHLSLASLAGIVDCAVADSAGQVAVPAAVLKRLGASPTAISILHVWREKQSEISPNIFLTSQYDLVIPAQLH